MLLVIACFLVLVYVIRVLRVSMYNLLFFFCLDFVLWPLSGFYVLDFEMPLVFAFIFSDQDVSSFCVYFIDFFFLIEFCTVH